MRRIPIRAKLAASLAVPLIGLLAFSAQEVRDAADDASRVRSETDLATAASGPNGLISRLHDERNWSVIELTGLEGTYEVAVAGYDETRAATDDAIRSFRDDVESKGGAVEATYREALGALDGLGAIRGEIDDFSAPRTIDNMPFSTEIYDSYSGLIHGLLDATSRITLQVRDADLRQGTELASLASAQLEAMADVSRQTAVDAMLSPGGIDTSAEITRVVRVLSVFDGNNEQIESATGRYAAIVREHHPRDMAQLLHQKVRETIVRGTIDDLETFLEGTTPAPGTGYWALRDAATEALTARADELDDAAVARQRLFATLAIGAFVLAAVITWLVSRSITRPLRSLTRQAKDMAQHRLPEAVLDILATPLGDDVHVPHVQAVAVQTRDEVADVTDALNTVQRSALELAFEQAVLRRNIADSFVNLGRRNQNLLGRQLDFITELESNETDPDTLASLFRLDHLATRMRRNAESLLVLAGVEPARKSAAPVRLTDIVRAALGEVEDYQRVQVNGVEPVMIIGSAAADLAHLLAELLENALTFSAPQDQVVVRGQGHATGYSLAVLDRGLGMPVPALEEANRRLAQSESFTVAPSKYLGHYVAGHLAARHGVRIQLESGGPEGVVAVVDVPVHLLTGEAQAAPAAPVAPVAPPRQPVTAAPALAASAPAPAPGPAAGNPFSGGPPPVAPRTAGGLPVRVSPAPVPDGQERGPAPAADLLAALEHHTQRLRRDGTAPGSTVTGSGLPRRVSGAQMPATEPTRLHRPGTRAGAGKPARPSPADDVYSFLSGFSSGVQRGLDESRPEDS